jgi:transcriptional regulator with XRE-family HTH domain
MTPFGERLRALRLERSITLKDMAKALHVSSAYLSALEHGKRGRPSWHLLQGVIAYLNIIWDDAENLVQLAKLSHPRITIDTAGLSPAATELANRLARDISSYDETQIRKLLAVCTEDR